MRVKSICLVCRGRGKRMIDNIDTTCIGCNGYGFIFVEHERIQVSHLPTPKQARVQLHVRDYPDERASRFNLKEKVIAAVEQYQQIYLKTRNIMHLRPMRLQDIATVVGCDAATVSVHLKECDIQGIRSKDLFSEGVSGVSRKVVMEMISKILLDTPMSDSKMVIMLQTYGITVARRTITKYRKILMDLK